MWPPARSYNDFKNPDAPLTYIRGSKGILGCGYFNAETFNRETIPGACAVVSGVSSFQEMLEATVVAASDDAVRLGIVVGQTTGRETLELLR